MEKRTERRTAERERERERERARNVPLRAPRCSQAPAAAVRRAVTDSGAKPSSPATREKEGSQTHAAEGPSRDLPLSKVKCPLYVSSFLLSFIVLCCF